MGQREVLTVHTFFRPVMGSSNPASVINGKKITRLAYKVRKFNQNASK